MSEIIDENRRHHGQAMAEVDGPIKVRLVPDSEFTNTLYLGPIGMCGGASRWLRETFPRGATFKVAWDRCPQASWMRHMVRVLSATAKDPEAPEWSDKM